MPALFLDQSDALPSSQPTTHAQHAQGEEEDSQSRRKGNQRSRRPRTRKPHSGTREGAACEAQATDLSGAKPETRQRGKGRARASKSTMVPVQQPDPGPPMQSACELPPAAGTPEPPSGWCDAVSCVYQDLLPDEEEHQRREEVLEEIRQVVNNCSGGTPPCRLDVYGSFVSGMYSLHSDLDLTVVPCVPGGQPVNWSLDHARSCIARYHKALKKHGVTTHALSQMRLRARVPLVVFEHCLTGLRCDLSFNNTNGIFKAHLLSGLKKLDPRFQELYMLVKAWARAQGINDSAEGTFNSWCLAMLVMFYLQTRQSPAILPPLRRLFDTRGQAQDLAANPDNNPAWARHRELVDQHIGFGKANTTPVGTLLLGFLDCMETLVDIWTKSHCCYKQGRVNVWDGAFCSGFWAREYRMSVEDPFDPTDNCARTITYEGVDIVKSAMSATRKALQHLRSSADVTTSVSMLFTARPVPSHPAQNWTNLLPSMSTLAPGAALLAALTTTKPGLPSKSTSLLQELFHGDARSQAPAKAAAKPGTAKNNGMQASNNSRNHMYGGIKSRVTERATRNAGARSVPSHAQSTPNSVSQQQQKEKQMLILQQQMAWQAKVAAQRAMSQYPPGMPTTPYLQSALPAAGCKTFSPQYNAVMNNS